MSATGMASVTLHADQEHSGIRVAVFIALFAGYLLGFRITLWLIETFAPPNLQDYGVFLSCVGGLPIALAIIWGLEKLLKRYWHSGLSLTLDGQGLFVNDTRFGAQPQTHTGPAIDWRENLSQLNWHFRLKGYPRGGRERRVPAKWHCLATEVQQDESRLSVYTLLPVEKATRWIENPKYSYHILNMAELYDNSVRSRIGPPSRPSIPNRLLQSKDGRYWLAERRRWEYGIELSPEDFATLMRYIDEAMRIQINSNLS